MPLSVGTLTAYLKLDMSDYEKGLSGAERKFSSAQSSFVSGAKVIAGTLTAAGIAAGALSVAVFKTGANYNKLQQNSRAALKTLLGGAEAANKQMDKLDDFAKTSPFAKQVFITAQQQLLGFGMEAEKVVPTLDAIQNSVAAVGGSSEDVAELARTFAKVEGTGKITAITLNELGIRGVNAAKIIGDEMGKTEGEIRDSITAGTLDAGKAMDALTTGMMTKFGGATDEIKKQMDGATDRIKAAWRDIGSIIAAPFIDPMGGGRAVDWANALADAMRALETKAKPAVDLLMKRYGPALDTVSKGLEALKTRIERFDVSKIDGQLDKLSKYTPLIAGLGAGLAALGGSAILGPLARFLPILNPVVAGIAALVATSPELRDVGRAVIDALAPLAPLAGTVAVAVADLALETVQRLSPALIELVQAAGPVVAALATGLTPAILATLEAGVPLVDIVARIVETVAKVPTPILAGVTAFLALNKVMGPAAPAIRGVANAFRALSERAAVQASLGGVSTSVGALSTASMAARGSVSKLGTAMKTAFISNPVGIAVAAVATAIGIFVKNAADAKARTEAWTATLDDFGNTTDDTTKKINELLVEDRRGWLDKTFGSDMKDWTTQAEQFGISIEDLQGYLLGEAEATERVTRQLEDYIAEKEGGSAAQRTWAEAARGFKTTVDKERDALDGASDATKRKKELDEAAGITTDESTEKIKSNTDVLRENTDAKRDAADGAKTLRESELRVLDAQQSVTDSIERANEVRKDEESSKDEIETANRNVEKSQLSLIDTYEAARQKMFDTGASTEDLTQVTQDQRDAFIDNEIEAGNNATAAGLLADAYGLIPEDVVTDLIVNSEEAIERTDTLRKLIEDSGDNLNDWIIDADGTKAVNEADGTVVKIDKRTGNITIDGNGANALAEAVNTINTINNKSAMVNINAKVSDNAWYQLNRFKSAAQQTTLGVGTVLAARAHGGVVGFAGGGQVPGKSPSNPNVDNILAMTQNGSAYGIRSGEWIINEPASKKNDVWLRAINGGLDLNKVLGSVPGLATGAAVDIVRNARVPSPIPAASRGPVSEAASAIARTAPNQPVNIYINSVPTDHVEETAKALNFALRSRGGVYGIGAR